MELLDIRVLRGPNYWSTFHKQLIAVKVDLQHVDIIILKNCYFSLKKFMPTFVPQDLFNLENKDEISSEILFAQLLVLIIIKLHNLSGMDCKYIKTFSAYEKGHYFITFAFKEENAGILAVHSALQLINSFSSGKLYPHLIKDLDEIRSILQKFDNNPCSKLIQEAAKRNIPVIQLNTSEWIQFGYGVKQKKVNLWKLQKETFMSETTLPAHYVEQLFPDSGASKIPLIAVTGTNGKTTVVRLIAHLASQHYHVGFTCTDGIYVNKILIEEGDCSGPLSALVILSDPSVDFAVLECARGGILRSGLGFDECDVSIITNISEDHLGLNDIHSIEDMARVKAVVALSTKKNGYALLNAEDDLVYELKNKLKCNIGLFALKENQRIRAHFLQGGLGIYTENNAIIIFESRKKRCLGDLRNLPLTFRGEASSMIKNLLPSILTGVIYKFPDKDIFHALNAFFPSASNTPGRMNIFDFGQFKVMIDYAHNEGAYIELKKYLARIKCTKKVGVISVAGDRRAEDIQLIGYHSCQIFDEIIIKHSEDNRGRTKEQLTEWLMQGINKYNPEIAVKVISQELQALEYAMEHAIEESFIFFTVVKVFSVIDYLDKKLSILNKISR